MFLDERAKREASVDELHGRMDQMLEVQEGLQASVPNIEHNWLVYNNSYKGHTIQHFQTRRRKHARHETSGNQSLRTYNVLNRLEFPHFDGENARGWVRRCSRYFQLIPIPKDQRVSMASIYMQGKAELWYQGYVEKKEFRSWDEFVANVLGRFEALNNAKVTTEFNKLHHETTVDTYLERFEELKDQMVIFNKSLDEDFFMMKFISGLKDEVKLFVTNCEPTSLNHAITLLETKNKQSMVYY
ncbi:UNVERIFIED_CONTAM: hypothetical protein Sindi_2705900 [Sesamum indicum]